MICVAFFLLYLAIRHKFEPLLLFTIAFGMLLTNLPGANLYHTELFADGHVHWDIFVANAGLLDYLYLGVKLGIYPCLIFVGVGAMTDFGPLIANPKSFLLGAAADRYLRDVPRRLRPGLHARAGRFHRYHRRCGRPDGHLPHLDARPRTAGPDRCGGLFLHGARAGDPAAHHARADQQEGAWYQMRTLRPVSKLERILFPLIIAVIISLLLPSAAPLIGCLMLGNLMKEVAW